MAISTTETNISKVSAILAIYLSDLPPVFVPLSKLELPAQELAVLSQEPVVGILERYADGIDYTPVSTVQSISLPR